MVTPTWTYGYDPDNSDIDKLRLIIGDTDVSVTTNCLFADQEIDYWIEEGNGNIHFAAHHALKALAAKFAKLADRTLGPMSISYSQMAARYQAQAVEEFDCATNDFSITPTPYSFTTEDGDRDRSLEDGTTKKVPAEFYRDMEEDYGDIASEDDLRIHWT